MFVKCIVVSTLFSGRVLSTPSPDVSLHTDSTSQHAHREVSVVDPCVTLCHLMAAGDCSLVQAVGSYCANLFKDGERYVVDSRSSNDHVSSENAFSEVSTSSCSSACQRTADCPGSFCKPNNHCHGLFWANKASDSFCFHGESHPCNSLVPVHCDSTGTVRTTVAPELTVSEAEATIETITSEIVSTALDNLKENTITSLRTTNVPMTEATAAVGASNANALQQASSNSACSASVWLSMAMAIYSVLHVV